MKVILRYFLILNDLQDLFLKAIQLQILSLMVFHTIFVLFLF